MGEDFQPAIDYQNEHINMIAIKGKKFPAVRSQVIIYFYRDSRKQP